jgi:hypothetical protein
MTGRLWPSSWALQQPNPPRSRNRRVGALSTTGAVAPIIGDGSLKLTYSLDHARIRRLRWAMSEKHFNWGTLEVLMPLPRAFLMRSPSRWHRRDPLPPLRSGAQAIGFGTVPAPQ